MDLALEPVAAGFGFPEGPVWLADGAVVLVEIETGRITRVEPDGAKSTVCAIGGGPNGLAVGPDGALYVCNNNGRFQYHRRDGLLIPGHAPPGHAGGMVQRVDMGTGAVETLYDRCDGQRLFAPNDLVFDAHGDFWFTDHGWADGEGSKYGGLYWARGDGSRIAKAATLPTPNGVGLSPDGGTVYVADTHTGRLWAYPVTGEGEVGYGELAIAGQKGRVVATMPGYQLFDSLAVEADGRVCVATIINGGITAIEPSGAFEHFPVPDLVTTNLCFGGADMRDVWITASSTGVLYRGRWPRPGLKLHFNA